MPDTTSDYYQCCLFPSQCETFYYINIAQLVALVGCFILGLIFVRWVRYQSLLWLACFFQAIVIVWRVLYSGIGGYETATWFEYITYRSSDPGDVPSFCIPLALMLYDLKHKLQSRDDLY